MGLKRCKMGKKQQLRLLECLVLEVTARSEAVLVAERMNCEEQARAIALRRLG